ncbi:MAG: phosphotransferase [Proteobacteria bacterium]|nr:phosphotransferase [Pseudomonadota bacterium]
MPLRWTELTLQGRARRLRALAEAALASYDLDVRRMRLITNTWNCIFRLDTPTGPLVLRVTLPGHGHDLPMVQAEADYLEALGEATDLLIPAPIRNHHGELVTEASAPGVPEPRTCIVFSWVPGPDLARHVTPANWRLMGELMARLHDFGEAWTPPPGFTVGTYDSLILRPDPVVVADADLGEHRSVILEAWELADQRVRAVAARDSAILCHGDLHQWNVKLHRGVLGPIDFEEVVWSAPLLDAMVSLYYVSSRPEYPALFDAFRDGYSSLRPWFEQELGEVEGLLIARGLDLLNVIAGDDELEMSNWEAFVGKVARLARSALARA